jgi:hypothetical protein
MPRGQRTEPDLPAVKQVFNTATVAVGGLYLATHSVIVTLIGAMTGCLLTCWALWLAHRREQMVARVAVSDTNSSGTRQPALRKPSMPRQHGQ